MAEPPSPGHGRTAVAEHADSDLLAALRAGDEAAFVHLVRTLSPALLRVAALHVPSRAIAEEVVQETWLAVVEGLDRFRGESSLRTWIFRILTNRAKTRGQRERRSVPFSGLVAEGGDRPAVDHDRFLGEEARYPGHWANPPVPWDTLPEERLVSGETRAAVEAAIASLPPRQRAVVTLRDVHGWDAAEVCEVLEVSAANQRVLLHRGRSAVRRVLEAHLA